MSAAITPRNATPTPHTTANTMASSISFFCYHSAIALAATKSCLGIGLAHRTTQNTDYDAGRNAEC